MIYSYEKLEELEKEKLVELVVDCKDRAEKNQLPYFQKFKEFYEQYRSYIADDKIRPNGANLFIPYSFEAIETIAPRLVTAVFNNRPYITAIPLGGTAPENARNMEMLLDYQAEKYLDPVLFFTMAFKNALIYGTSIVKSTWKFDQKTIRVNDFESDPRLSAVQRKKVNTKQITTYDAPYMEIVPLENFFIDPNASEIDEARFVIHRYYEDIDSIKAKVKDKTYTATQDELDKIAESDDEYSSTYSQSQRVDGVTGGNTKPYGMVEVLEFWGDDCMVKVAGDVVLHFDYNPFYHAEKPFVKFIDYPLAGEFYGIGEIEVIQSLQEELNTARNQRTDNVSLAINNMWKVRRSSGIDVNQLISRPNGIVEVDEMDDLDVLTVPDMTESAYKEEQIIKDDIDRTTGVNDYTRGGAPSRRETATTASLLTESANERFKLKIRLLEKTSFKKVGYQLMALNQQFITEETEVLIFDKDRKTEENYQNPTSVKLQPQDIAGQFDLLPCGSTSEPMANKELRQTQITQLFNIMGDSPNINQPEFLKSILEAFDFKNVDKLIVQQPPMPEAMPGEMPPPAGAMPPQGMPPEAAQDPNFQNMPV